MTANGCKGGRAETNFGGTIFRIKVGPGGGLAREQTFEITGVLTAAGVFEAKSEKKKLNLEYIVNMRQ